MGTPAAVFPGAVVTDNQLRVANNNIQTTLASPMLSTDTSATVVNAAGIAANSIITIDNEKLAVWSVSGNVLTFGKSSSGNLDGRGFDGAAAAAHASGAAVAMNVDAWHHNAMKEEIKAIETALGPNLANVQTAPLKYSNQFNFAAITPGGSLSIGANTINFALPPGISADSVDIAQLYISGGTGSAEVVPIIGVGAGSVTVTCQNTHTGAWTIQSATSGVQEAVIATAGYGRVQMPGGGPGLVTLQGSSGASTVPGCVTVPGNYIVSLRGMGKGVTDIHCTGLTGDRIYFKKGTGAYVDVGDFSIRNGSGSTHTSGSMLRVSYKVYGDISNIESENGLIGIQTESCNNVQPKNCIVGAQTYCFQITSNGVSFGSGALSSGDMAFCRGSLTGSSGAAFRIEGPCSGVMLTDCLGGAVTPGTMNQALQIVYDSTLGGQEISVVGGAFDAGGVGVGIQGDGVSYPQNWYIFTGVEAAGSEYGFFGDGKIANVKWTGGLIKGAGGTAQQSIFLRNAQNCRFDNVDLECLGTNAITVDTVTDIRLNGLVVGKNGTTPGNVLNFSGAAVRLTIENSDFSALSSVLTNVAIAANPVRLTNNVGLYDTVYPNFIAAETGANNAIVAPLAGVSTGALAAGLRGSILLAHSLQAGANTLNLGGTGVKNIKSSRNPANNIGTAYVSGAIFSFVYDGTEFLDVSQ